MERKFVFSEDEYYHLYNRGSGKRDIFISHKDYERFMAGLYLSNSNESFSFRDLIGRSSRGESFGVKIAYEQERGETLVDIGAYCLMPNHFHLLVKAKKEKGVSNFMLKLGTGYSMYFNKKNERTGNLFEGEFKAVHVDSDEYLKYLFSYIHLNPVKIIDPGWREKGLKNKSKTKNFLHSYQFSSYLDCLGINRLEKVILNKKAFPGYFLQKGEFEDFIDDWLSYLATDPTPEGSPRELGADDLSTGSEKQ